MSLAGIPLTTVILTSSPFQKTEEKTTIEHFKRPGKRDIFNDCMSYKSINSLKKRVTKKQSSAFQTVGTYRPVLHVSWPSQ